MKSIITAATAAIMAASGTADVATMKQAALAGQPEPKPKRVRSRKAKVEAAPVRLGQTKKATMPKDPNWTRRTDPNWKIAFIAARAFQGNLPLSAEKRDLQAAKRMAMKQRRKGGSAAVRHVVLTEV